MAKVSDAHLEARKRSILDAASRVFSREGIELATMADVAAEAGISPGAIYRYFQNKDALALCCMNESADAIEAQWAHPNEASDDPMRDFAELCRLTLRQLDKPSERLSTMLAIEQMLNVARSDGAEDPMSIPGNHQKVISSIAARLEAGKKKGQVPEDIDTTAMAGALFSFYWGARLMRMVDPAAATGPQLEALIQLIRHAGG